MASTAAISSADHADADREFIPCVLPPEDRARADLYALLARLFASGPDRPLMQAIAAAPGLEAGAVAEGHSALGHAWNALCAASAAMEADAAAQEYVELFVGVGKSEINLHASHWLTGFMMEKPLAEVRASLAVLGIARRADAGIVEDHLSALCETMRLLIAGHATRPSVSLDQQSRFFARHIAPWVGRCTGAIRAHRGAIYYRRVAALTENFMAVEHESFAIG